MNIFIETTLGTADWVWRNITFDVPWSENYFWALTLLSVLVWVAEIVFPWRKSQGAIRHDFWLDAFYMYFNFFIFSIAISGAYALIGHQLEQMGLSSTSFSIVNLRDWPIAAQLLVFFVSLDFLQWITHRALHRFKLLWRFHQVHHSIKEMGFAGHLRYHWMENLLYKPAKTLGVMLLGGFEPEQAFVVHFFTIVIGHLNHSNIKLSYGPLKYVLNNPVMHLYHHAYTLPQKHKYGVNFGISLSVWDYLFRTAYIPEESGRIVIGYPNDNKLPSGFLKQCLHGFRGA